MKMYEIQPMGTLATLLDKFNDLGGVLDYVLIALAGPIPSDCNPYDLHKAAAVFTVQTAYARNPDYPGRGPRIETEKAHGAQITPVDFFAPRYVWVDSTDLSASPYVGIINPGELLTLPDLLALPQAQKEGGIYVSTQGYAWAFSDPPYGLATHEVENLFHEINQQLFGDDLAALTI